MYLMNKRRVPVSPNVLHQLVPIGFLLVVSIRMIGNTVTEVMRNGYPEGRHTQCKDSRTDRNRLRDIPTQNFELKVIQNAEKLKS